MQVIPMKNKLPLSPNWVYRHKWKGWDEFLGTGRIVGGSFMSFTEARAYVRQLNLGSAKEWEKWTKTNRALSIPTHPNRFYAEEWVNWRDWLGPKIKRVSKWTPFAEAKQYVHKIGLKNEHEWRIWSKSEEKPYNIPACPSLYPEWQGWGDWLGTGTVANRNKKFRDYTSAQLYASSLGLKNAKQWKKWARSKEKPLDIPCVPEAVYSEWVSYGDWLGTNYVSTHRREFLPFEEARAFVRTLGLKNQNEWVHWCQTKRPPNIPSNPDKNYEEYVNMGDWLGTGYVSLKCREFRPFEKARDFVRSLRLRSRKNYVRWSKSERPVDIPSHPWEIYKEWQSWADWLGE